MRIAVPSDSPGGLDARISDHFGHCDAFTVVTVQDGAIGDVSVLDNSTHDTEGCLGPVRVLKDNAVDVLVAGGMGGRPLAGFQDAGIKVHFKENAAAVREAVELFLAGQCRAFGEAETCGGHGGSCGGHHHAEPEREPIVGPADIRDGRVVTLAYELRSTEGKVLDASERSGPMRYLHGAGQMLPGLEKAVSGLVPGAKVTVELGPGEAFGPRDESRVVEVARAQLPPDARLGGMVSAEDPQGHRFTFTIVQLGDDQATLDGNHPLAGRDLVFDLTVTAVESATADELAHGHVH